MSYPLVLYRQSWSSSTHFVIACVAATVTLGDFWRLPYLLATYGGGAFLLAYAAALLLMGLPVFSAQVFVARGTRTDLPGVIDTWAVAPAHSRLWRAGAYAALLGVFFLLAAYAVVAAWLLGYGLRALGGLLPAGASGQGAEVFAAYAGDPERGLGWLLLFIMVLVATAAPGLRRGVEPVLRTLMWLMILLVVVLLVAALHGTSARPLPFSLLQGDFAALGLRGFCEAFYQAFFSLGLGTGVIMAFGSRLPARACAVRLSALVIIASQIVAGLFAFLLVSVVGHGAAGSMTGLQWLFEFLPSAARPTWALPLVFLLFVLTAVAAGIGLFEPLVQMVERRLRVTRAGAAVYAGIAVAPVAVIAQNGFGGFVSETVYGRNLFAWLVLVSAHGLLPAVTLMFCVLVSSVLARQRLRRAWCRYAGAGATHTFAVWHALLSYPARLALIVVLAYAAGAMAWIEMFWGLGS